MKRHVMGMAVAAASAVIGVSSQAASSIAVLQDINFTLVDLNPADGIDPSLFPFPGAESGFSYLVDGYSPSGPGDVADGFLTAPPIVVPFGEQPNAGASGSMTPSNSVTVEADATGTGTAMIDGSAAGDWTITPYTSVTMTATSVFQTLGVGASESASICIDSICNSFQSFTAGTADHSYSLTFTNDTDEATTILVTVDDNASVSSVPELPTSWLMLAAGALFGMSMLKAGKRVG